MALCACHPAQFLVRDDKRIKRVLAQTGVIEGRKPLLGF